jgi:hypothetical protein
LHRRRTIVNSRASAAGEPPVVRAGRIGPLRGSASPPEHPGRHPSRCRAAQQSVASRWSRNPCPNPEGAIYPLQQLVLCRQARWCTATSGQPSQELNREVPKHAKRRRNRRTLGRNPILLLSSCPS